MAFVPNIGGAGVVAAPPARCRLASRGRPANYPRGTSARGVQMNAEASTAAADPIAGVTDLYQPFWEHADAVLKQRLPQLDSYPIPEGFERKEAVTGRGSKAQRVRTTSYGYRTDKLRQIRAAHVQGGKSLQVLNFVIFPELSYRLPFFGADLVTLPGGHLIALDMQPLFHDDAYLREYYDGLKGIFERYQSVLPWGGDFPEEAKPFFSPCFLWTRPAENGKVQNEVFGAFKEYLDLYLKYVDRAQKVTDADELRRIEDSQKAYLHYRAEKDPARGMFRRFYGEQWTEEYIHGFLFDLEAKIADGSYTPPSGATAGS